jgi:hypothetical protein
MICLSRKARNATFRNYVAAETATPVIGCAAGLKASDAKNFYFAGVCRSKTVRPIDDGTGPSVDEFFTLHIGGMVVRGAAHCRPVAERSHAHAARADDAQQLERAGLPGRHARVRRRRASALPQSALTPRARRRWTLTSEKMDGTANNTYANKRLKTGPRRVGIKVASPTSERVIGRCAPPLDTLPPAAR